jgi:hypothetical protein
LLADKEVVAAVVNPVAAVVNEYPGIPIDGRAL